MKDKEKEHQEAEKLRAQRKFALRQVEAAHRLREMERAPPPNVVVIPDFRRARDPDRLRRGVDEVIDTLLGFFLPIEPERSQEKKRSTDVQRGERPHSRAVEVPIPQPVYYSHELPVPREGSWRAKILAERARGERGVRLPDFPNMN